MISVVLADDHPLVRQGLRALLEGVPGIHVVGETGDGSEVPPLVAELAPDVAVLDLSMPGRSGVELARELAARHPRTRTLVLSMHASEELIASALAAGARGYVLKSNAAHEVVEAIRAVAAGLRFLGAPHGPGDLDRLLRRAEETGGVPLARLTPRQREVLRGVAGGRTNAQIATALGISVRTVESHRAALGERLGLRSAAELTRFAIEHGVAPDRSSST